MAAVVLAQLFGDGQYCKTARAYIMPLLDAPCYASNLPACPAGGSSGAGQAGHGSVPQGRAQGSLPPGPHAAPGERGGMSRRRSVSIQHELIAD